MSLSPNNSEKETIGFHVLLAAAGKGLRLGNKKPKQYIKIAGKPLLRHTIDNILTWPGLLSLNVIIDPEHADMYQDCITGLDLPPPLHGGKERNNSINNALNNLSNVKDEDIILIHDAARPFTAWENVYKLLLEFRGYARAASLAIPVSDTLRKAGPEDMAGDVVTRDGLWAMQTPQAFYFSDIKQAHEKHGATKTVTDDTQLVSDMGIPVKLVEGGRNNIKITTQEDLKMAEAVLSGACETRTGLGFDVHAFEEKENTGRALVLCGVEIEHPRVLAGHSDADVGLHALTDALLGAIGAQDIGHHFPPSDETFKNMDSAIFLEKAVEIVENQGGAINNIDITLICEAPKIGPHRDKMIDKISKITGLEKPRINIKATTTEKLGFTGRGEGIAAQAVANVRLPL